MTTGYVFPLSKPAATPEQALANDASAWASSSRPMSAALIDDDRPSPKRCE